MEFKTFKDLRIGDTIYKILSTKIIIRRDDGDRYVQDGNIVEKSTVMNLDINRDGYLLINRHDGYSNTTYEYVLKPETAAAKSFEDKRGSIIFADKRLAYVLARKQVVSGIKELEAKIPATIRQVEDDIKSVRERYFDVLNGTEYDLAETIQQ